MKKIGKTFWFDFVKTSFVSLIICLVLTLGLTVFIGFVPLTEKTILIVNQVFKCLSLFIGCLLCFGEKSNGLLKGLLSGAFFALFSFVLYGFIAGFSFDGMDVVDILLTSLIGMICGVLAVNITGKKA